MIKDEILTPLSTEGERVRGCEEKNNKDEPDEIATSLRSSQ